MADKTIGELPAVKESPIGELPQVIELYDDSKLPVEQQGEAKHMTGKQWRQYAEACVQDYVDDAEAAANAAKQSAQAAEKSAGEAAQSAEDAANSAEQAEQYSGKPPKIENNTWWVWDADAQEYIDTGKPARGNVMYATFEVNVDSGELYMYTDEEYTGPTFWLNDDAELEVVINHG